MKKLKSFCYKIKNAFIKNVFDEQLEKYAREQKSRFLIFWNRGLGDVPLGLYALCYRIKTFIPHASITFLTREDLKDVFSMLNGVEVVTSKKIKRGETLSIQEILLEENIDIEKFDVVIDRVDSKKWLQWQIGTLVPKLEWKKEWDMLGEKFSLPKDCLAVHVSSETSAFYAYDKNWPKERFDILFEKVIENRNQKIILFGMAKTESFASSDIIDLRGETSFLEMLSIIKNHCSHMLAPDSGVLSSLYYVDTTFPIKIVSLWSDRNQGVLKQAVASPNELLIHRPLCGKKGNIKSISVNQAFESLYS